MRMRRLVVAAAIVSTLGFSCYNEPDYPRSGMSNGPAGSGSGIASIANGAQPVGTAPGTSLQTATHPDSSKSAAKKRP
jgi:hypothetical protein